MIALRQQFGMANLNRSGLDILRDVLIVVRGGAQHFLDLRLMREVGYLSRVNGAEGIYRRGLSVFLAPTRELLSIGLCRTKTMMGRQEGCSVCCQGRPSSGEVPL